MSIVSLRERAYEKNKKAKEILREEGESLFQVVDDIVKYLLREKASLILDVEKGIIKRKELDDIISDYIRLKNIVIKEVESYEEIINNVNDYLWGYGFVNRYIDERDISDISIKGLEDTWIKKNGTRILTDIKFPSTQSILNFAYSVAIKNGGNLSKRDAIQLLGDSDTSRNFNLRINLGISPVNTQSPHIVIRKIPKWHIKPDFDELQRREMFDEEIKQYLINAFQKGLNMLIVGKGASGKTTLLNAGIEYIPESLSKLAIQEIEELSSGKKNWIWQTVVKKSGEGDIEYDLQKLATNGLLLDIDWYIIGESKGAESMSLFDASFTGHKVALTAHAPSSMEGIEKVILNMKKSGTDYKRRDLLKMLSTLDTVLFLDKYKIAEVTEVKGWDEEKGELLFNPVFEYSNRTFKRINQSCEKINKKLMSSEV